MAQYISEVQKERETWLASMADSNSNPGSRQAPVDEQIRAIMSERSEIISDNIQLLRSKIFEATKLDPEVEDVEFIIVKLLASHIE